VVSWQQTEIVTLDLEGAIEARAEIFQGYRRAQFDNLFSAEKGCQLFKHHIRDFSRRPAHALGVAQHRLFAIIEMAAGLECGKIL